MSGLIFATYTSLIILRLKFLIMIFFTNDAVDTVDDTDSYFPFNLIRLFLIFLDLTAHRTAISSYINHESIIFYVMYYSVYN